MRWAAPGLIRMCRMNASIEVITILTVHRGAPLLQDGVADRPRVGHRHDSMPAERRFVTKMKQIGANGESTVPWTSECPGKRKLAPTVMTAVNGSQVVAGERKKAKLHQRNTLKHIAGNQGWGVTNIAPRFIRVNPECEVRGNLVKRSQDTTHVRWKGVAE